MTRASSHPSFSARAWSAHVAGALRCGFYLPLPAQQGSVPQIGVGAGDVLPAGNQQQQPLQSVHAAFDMSGLQLHVELDPLEADPLDALPLWLVPLLAVPLLLVPLLAVPLLLVPLLAVPLLLVPLLLVPLLAVPLLPTEPLLPAPLLAEPLLLVPVLAEPLPAEPLVVVSPPQAARPTVDEAPITTTTWNSLSMFMEGGIPHGKGRGPRLKRVRGGSQTVPPGIGPRDPMPNSAARWWTRGGLVSGVRGRPTSL
jgi:hypothetical protein